jgi:hypothetical protein
MIDLLRQIRSSAHAKAAVATASVPRLPSFVRSYLYSEPRTEDTIGKLRVRTGGSMRVASGAIDHDFARIEFREALQCDFH